MGSRLPVLLIAALALGAAPTAVASGPAGWVAASSLGLLGTWYPERAAVTPGGVLRFEVGIDVGSVYPWVDAGLVGPAFDCGPSFCSVVWASAGGGLDVQPVPGLAVGIFGTVETFAGLGMRAALSLPGAQRVRWGIESRGWLVSDWDGSPLRRVHLSVAVRGFLPFRCQAAERALSLVEPDGADREAQVGVHRGGLGGADREAGAGKRGGREASR